MSKTTLVLAILTVFINGVALAAEKFDSTIEARNNTGSQSTYRFTLEVEQLQPGSLTGEIKSWDSKACGSARKITGELKANGELRFATEESPVRGCGALIFSGKKESDSVIVGKMRFQGEQHEFTFKK
jgi:hypothetical protein